MTKHLITGKQLLTKSKRRMTMLFILVMVVFVTLTGFAWNNKTVTVVADGQTHTIETHLTSTDGILKAAGVTLSKEDEAKPNTSTIENGTVISVIRAFPVTVTVDGQTKTVMTTKTSPRALADSLGYTAPKYMPLGDDKTLLKTGSKVTIAHITGHAVNSYERPIEVQTVREPDANLPSGQEEVAQAGSVGTEEVTETVYYENGKAVIHDITNKKVITQMVPRIIKVGTKQNAVATDSGTSAYREVITMNATAYTPADGDGNGITASGMVAQRGVVAVDPSVIPLGTRLYIPGYGEAIAADTGGAIQGNRIDLLMDTYGEAMDFGRRNVEVYVLS